jgi:acyl dehydratase
MGRYLEDFTPGETIKHWPGRTVRDFDDTWFTLMTMNTNPLHIDEHFASQSQHGRCLVNGTLVFALAVGMSVRDISETAIANLEYEKILHHAPTYHGDTIYAESDVLEVTPSATKADRGVVYVETRARNQRGEVVLSLRRRVLVPRRGSRPETSSRVGAGQQASPSAEGANAVPRPAKPARQKVSRTGDRASAAGKSGRTPV